MTGPDHRDCGPAQAGRDLAELANRLRLSRAGDPATAAPAWTGRLQAAARCWRRVAGESGVADFAGLAAGLEQLAAVLDGHCAPATELSASLLILDDRLAGLLARYDAGEPVASLRADPDWDLLPGGGAPQRAAAGTVALLVASPFLRGILASRLAAAGRPAVAAGEPVDVLRLLTGPRPPVLVLCDNEEPTNHLRRLRGLLAGADRPPPALVLVAAAGEPAPGRERRARAAGADAVWPEPWRAEHLPVPGTVGGNG